MKTKFTVLTLDVWGNAHDGYAVNDVREIGSIEIDPSDDQDIIQELLEADILSSFSGTISDKFDIDGDEDTIYINRKIDGYPLLQLNRAA